MNFQLLIIGDTGNVNSYYITTELDLLDQYKTALIQGKGFVIWDKGVIDFTRVIGVLRTDA